MGGLRRYMPITYITSVIGSLALAGIPPFSGFFSKDAIIEAVHHSNIPGAGLAYAAVLGGVVVTAFYSFRLIFMVFHGEPRMDKTGALTSERKSVGGYSAAGLVGYSFVVVRWFPG